MRPRLLVRDRKWSQHQTASLSCGREQSRSMRPMRSFSSHDPCTFRHLETRNCRCPEGPLDRSTSRTCPICREESFAGIHLSKFIPVSADKAYPGYLPIIRVLDDSDIGIAPATPPTTRKHHHEHFNLLPHMESARNRLHRLSLYELLRVTTCRWRLRCTVGGPF